MVVATAGEVVELAGTVELPVTVDVTAVSALVMVVEALQAPASTPNAANDAAASAVRTTMEELKQVMSDILGSF